MRISFCLLLIFSLSHFLFAQEKRDYVWTIGDNTNSGILHPDFGGVNLNFSSDSLEILRVDRIEKSFGSNSSSISNKAGELLFYTGGCFVVGKDDEIIENGDIINEGEFRDRCTQGRSYISGNASTLFLPKPDNENEYYLIHQRVDAIGSAASATLLYSIISEETNNGLGGVTEINIPIPVSYTHLTLPTKA